MLSRKRRVADHVQTRLVLASGSPRRRDFLTQHGFQFEVIAADIDESVLPGEAPDVYVERLAREKATAVLQRLASDALPSDGDSDPREDITVIGADTTVAFRGEILGKPADEDEARAMLRRLSGATHETITGIAVVRHETVSICVRTNVTFAHLTDHEIDFYVSTGEPLDKAGAYGIQGIAGAYVERIEGNVQNVAGLPMHNVILLLARVGLSPSQLRAHRTTS
jgi:septum formation protein